MQHTWSLLDKGGPLTYGFRSYWFAAFAGWMVHLNWHVLAAGFRVYRVPSESMSPTVPFGSRLMVDRHYYLTHPVTRGEIVVCDHPEVPGTVVVKRAIALSGDVLRISGDEVWVNGARVRQPYAYFGSQQLPLRMQKVGPLTLPDHKLYLLGDNRRISLDSRGYGAVDFSAVKGRAIYVVAVPGTTAKLL